MDICQFFSGHTERGSHCHEQSDMKTCGPYFCWSRRIVALDAVKLFTANKRAKSHLQEKQKICRV